METMPYRKKTIMHIKRNKGRYFAGGICLFIGGAIGLYLARKRVIYMAPGMDNEMLKLPPKVESIVELTDDVIANSHSLIDHIGRNGHPGNVIYCNETKQVFKSHREATRELGINSRDLWAYLKGLKGNARGYTFKTLGEANRPSNNFLSNNT